MPNPHLLRLVALTLLNRVFADIRDHDRTFDARSGVLRIHGEPLVVPRDWLRRDPGGRCIAQAIDDAWTAVTDTPFALGADLECSCLHAWHLTLTTTGIASEHGNVTFVEGCDDIACYEEAPHDHFPDVWALLPELLQARIGERFACFRASMEDDPATGEAFAAELAQALACEVHARIDRATFQQAMRLLACEDALAWEYELPTLPANSRLREVTEWLTTAIEVAGIYWHPDDRSLAPLLPWAMCGGYPPSADGVRDWLRAQGLSRKALRRLPRLPHAALDETLRCWLPNARSNWRTAVAWLGELLSQLYQARHRELDEERVRVVACVSAVAGLCGARLPGMPDPGEPGQRYIDDLYQDHRVAGTATHMVAVLSRHDAATAAILARTVLRTLVTVDDAGYREIHAHVSDVRDWICGDYQLRGDADRLGPADVGPDWATLMRRQRAWHDRWAAFRNGIGVVHPAAGAPPEPELAWASPVPAFNHGEFLVEPLDSSTALWEEGRAQGHCVASYSERCLRGDCRLFSLRNAPDGTRLGTAEFNRRPDGWQLVQFRAALNRQLLDNVGRPLEPYVDVMAELTTRLATCSERATPAIALS